MKGVDFVNFLKDIGYSKVDGLQGQDFDWLWETSAQPLVEWLCQNVTKENVLSDAETYQWRKFPKSNVLSGKNLDEALENVKEEDSSTVENVSELREELEARQINLTDLEKVKSKMSNSNARQTLSLHTLEQKLEASTSSMAEEQKRLLKLNVELNEMLNKHETTVAKCVVQEGLDANHFSVLFQENEKVLSSLRSVIEKRLHLEPFREIEEYESLAGEIHRLQVSIAQQEQKRVLHQAKAQGLESGLGVVKECLKIPQNSSSLPALGNKYYKIARWGTNSHFIQKITY